MLSRCGQAQRTCISLGNLARSMHHLKRLSEMLPMPGGMYLMIPVMILIMVLLNKEAGSVAGKQGKRKRGAAADSSSAGGRLPRAKKASLSLSHVFRISTIVPLLQQQWQEQREGQHMLPDLGASAAAFCLGDICGVVGKGSSGRVFAARCALSRLGSLVTVMPKHIFHCLCRSLMLVATRWSEAVWCHLQRHHQHANCLTHCALCS